MVGLLFARCDPTRDIVFLWVDAKEKGTLGLWEPSTVGFVGANSEWLKLDEAYSEPVRK